MRFEQVVAHGGGLRLRQHGRCVRVQRRLPSVCQPDGVVKRQVEAATKLQAATQVGHHVPGELDAARVDEDDLHHSSIVCHPAQFRARVSTNGT